MQEKHWIPVILIFFISLVFVVLLVITNISAVPSTVYTYPEVLISSSAATNPENLLGSGNNYTVLRFGSLNKWEGFTCPDGFTQATTRDGVVCRPGWAVPGIQPDIKGWTFVLFYGQNVSIDATSIQLKASELNKGCAPCGRLSTSYHVFTTLTPPTPFPPTGWHPTWTYRGSCTLGNDEENVICTKNISERIVEGVLVGRAASVPDSSPDPAIHWIRARTGSFVVPYNVPYNTPTKTGSPEKNILPKK